MRVPVDLIRTDGGTQPRGYVAGDVASRYAERMAEGDSFPPINLIFDGEFYWPWDGFHRLFAVRDVLGLKEIEAVVEQGTLREAIVRSCAANTSHGMQRTSGDCRRAVERLLRDDEWRQWSDARIAGHVSVSQPWVTRIRNELFPPPAPSDPGYVQHNMRLAKRGDTVYTINTAKIGKSRQPQPAPPPESEAVRGHREAAFKPRELAAEQTLLGIKAAMLTMPSPAEAARMVPKFDRDTVTRIAIWWADFEEELETAKN